LLKMVIHLWPFFDLYPSRGTYVWAPILLVGVPALLGVWWNAMASWKWCFLIQFFLCAAPCLVQSTLPVCDAAYHGHHHSWARRFIHYTQIEWALRYNRYNSSCPEAIVSDGGPKCQEKCALNLVYRLLFTIRSTCKKSYFMSG
jgi:hypothetical protein